MVELYRVERHHRKNNLDALILSETARRRPASRGCASPICATTFASTGASRREIMSRGGWRSIAMVVYYEHASKSDALLAQELNRYHERANLDRHEVRDDPKVQGEVIGPPPLISENDEKCSEGETRTLNLAGPLERDEYQHPLE